MNEIVECVLLEPRVAVSSDCGQHKFAWPLFAMERMVAAIEQGAEIESADLEVLGQGLRVMIEMHFAEQAAK